MQLPTQIAYVIIGAGVHGLSTAWHLAKELKARGRGSGEDIIVLDKTGVAAGASGIACGVIRNNYFQPAMRELMAHSVSIWERSEEHTSELQSRQYLVCRLLLEKKKKDNAHLYFES